MYRIINLLLLCVLSQSRDVQPQHEKYLPNYSVYHNLQSIGDELHQLVKDHSDIMTLDDYPNSKQGLPQYYIKVSNNIESENKARLLLSFGEHAREFLPTELLLSFLKNLTSGRKKPTESSAYQLTSKLLNYSDLHIVAMLNPDGRKHVETSGNFCWRGTSTGVDLNRNFDWEWGGKGSSDDPSDEEYRGAVPFSEPECQLLVELSSQNEFDCFVSFHSGIRHIYVPYSDSVSRKTGRSPSNVHLMLQLAAELARSTSSRFEFGLASKLNDYPADGVIYDYMAGVRRIPLSLAVELWGEGEKPDSKCFDLFNPPSSELKNTVRGLEPLLYTLVLSVVSWKQRASLAREIPANPEEAASWSLRWFVLLLVVLTVAGLKYRYPALRKCCRIPASILNNIRARRHRRIVSIGSLSETFSFSPVNLKMRWRQRLE